MTAARHRGALAAGLAGGLGLAVLASSGIAAGPANPRSTDAAFLDNSAGHDWPGPGRTYGEQHFSPLSEVNAQNVTRLGLAWSLDLDVGNSVTQPIAVNGVLYFVTGTGILHAVDAVRGRQLWSYDARVWEHETDKMRSAWGTRGVTWWNGVVYFGTMDGRLIAVDAASGKQRWSVETTKHGDGRFITGAPRVFDGKVLIGHGGADWAAIRGYVTCYDVATGKQLWRFYTVPGNPADGFESDAMKMAATTWHGEWWKQGGGGTAWNAMSYDPETHTVFIGTGNGAPWNHKVRSAGQGDNLFLSSIVALDANTGAYKWHYQTNPGENWDYNAAMDMQLANLMIAGVPRKVLMTAPKNGFFYVIDRTNGKLISATPFARITWASGIDLKTGRPNEVAGSRFENGPFGMAPGPVGAHSWLPMAYSPQTQFAYIPVIEMEMTLSDGFRKPEEWHRPPFLANNGADGVDMDESKSKGTSALVAVDPVGQKIVWRVPTPTAVSGGVLATAGGLVFQGTVDSRFSAYAAQSGKLLWSFAAGAPVIAPPIAYTVNGRQYVTVLSGSGGSLVLVGDAFKDHPIGYREQARRVLTFAIGGRAHLPHAVPYVMRPVSDPEYTPNPEAAQRGFAYYAQTCIMCHGRDVSALGGAAPDLRASPAILSAEAFHAIAKDGALKQFGMPPFRDLSNANIEDIRQYVRMKAHEAGARAK
jgi:quinohemoprotein ethanol dehydrogenase